MIVPIWFAYNLYLIFKFFLLLQFALIPTHHFFTIYLLWTSLHRWIIWIRLFVQIVQLWNLLALLIHIMVLDLFIGIVFILTNILTITLPNVLIIALKHQLTVTKGVGLVLLIL